MPSQDEIFAKVREALVDALGVDDDEVTPEATLRGIPISEHLAQLGEDAAATIRPAGSLSGDTVEG